MYPNDRKYSKEHEWAKQDINESLLVGITDYAQVHFQGLEHDSNMEQLNY